MHGRPGSFRLSASAGATVNSRAQTAFCLDIKCHNPAEPRFSSSVKWESSYFPYSGQPFVGADELKHMKCLENTDWMTHLVLYPRKSGRVRVTSWWLPRSKSMMHVQILTTTGTRLQCGSSEPQPSASKPTCLFAPLAALVVGCLPAESAEYPPTSHCPLRTTPHFIPSPPPGIFLPEMMSVVHSLSSRVIFMNIEQGLCQVLPPLLKGQSPFPPSTSLVPNPIPSPTSSSHSSRRALPGPDGNSEIKLLI